MSTIYVQNQISCHTRKKEKGKNKNKKINPFFSFDICETNQQLALSNVGCAACASVILKK